MSRPIRARPPGEPGSLVILTGPVHAGKTTLLKSFVQEAKRVGLPLTGYLSPAVWRSGDRIGYDLWAIENEESSPFLRIEQGRRSGRAAIGPYSFVPETLRRARTIIRRGSAGRWLVVDEVGPLELKGGGVWRALEGILSCACARLILVVREEVLAEFLAKCPAAIGVVIFRAEDGPRLAEYVLGE